MKIVIPVFTKLKTDRSYSDNNLRMVLALVNSYFYHGNDKEVVVVTNDTIIENHLNLLRHSNKWNLTIDFVTLQIIETDLKTLYNFYENHNKSQAVYLDNIFYVAKIWTMKNYTNSIVLDVDMLFRGKVDFEESENLYWCSGETVNDWDVSTFVKEKYRALTRRIRFHGGCVYIPKDFDMDLVLNLLYKSEYMLNPKSIITDELLIWVYISMGNAQKNLWNDINSYTQFATDRRDLIHFMYKPYKIKIDENKELNIQLPKKITEYNNHTINNIPNFTPQLIKFHMEWYLHLLYAKETLGGEICKDLDHVGSEFFKEIINVI